MYHPPPPRKLDFEEAVKIYRDRLQHKGIEDDRAILSKYSRHLYGHWELAVGKNEIIARVWDFDEAVQWELLEDTDDPINV